MIGCLAKYTIVVAGLKEIIEHFALPIVNSLT